MNHLKEQITSRIDWWWWHEKAVPTLWLWATFILVGACVGVWLRG